MCPLCLCGSTRICCRLPLLPEVNRNETLPPFLNHVSDHSCCASRGRGSLCGAAFQAALCVLPRDGSRCSRRANPARFRAQSHDADSYIESAGERSHETAGGRAIHQRAPGCGELSGYGGNGRAEARRNLEPMSGRRRMERRSGLDQLGRGSDQHAVPAGERSGIESRGSAEADGEMGFRVSGFCRAAVAAGCLPRQSVRREPGCVHWSTTVQAEVRSGITVAEVEGKPALFFGDSSGYLYGLDGATGKQLWKLSLDDHPTAKATSTPVFYQGRLYVGMSSLEEAISVSPAYVCCTFRGSVSAVQASDGKVVWKTYMVEGTPKEQPKTKRGSAVMGPSGVGVWTAPTLDTDHGVMYVTTGDNYSDPPTPFSDAVVALQMSTGGILWSKQLTAGDAWNSSCYLTGKVNCPDSDGPDFDFASSAALVSLPNGKRVLLVGQKSGIAYALDPERRGEILWQARVGKGGTVGGIEWGGATDGRNFYVALSDVDFQVSLVPGTNDRKYELDPKKGGGMFAFRVDNGRRIWQTPPPGCRDRRPC